MLHLSDHIVRYGTNTISNMVVVFFSIVIESRRKKNTNKRQSLSYTDTFSQQKWQGSARNQVSSSFSARVFYGRCNARYKLHISEILKN